jgi:hypothetical protein
MLVGNELNSFNIKNPSIEKDFLYAAPKNYSGIFNQCGPKGILGNSNCSG